MLSKWLSVTLLSVLLMLNLANGQKNLYNDAISFLAYTGTNNFKYTSQASLLQENRCNTSDLVSIILPGWLESCETEWVNDLIGNLKQFRGGCVLCMDYSTFSKNTDYFALVRQFSDITDVLVAKLRALQSAGFEPNNIYMFGFSYGGRLAVSSGVKFGVQKIGQIDTCDSAGPGFDGSLRKTPDPKLAAKNVQCIHTSSDKGTLSRNCCQNWNMGDCGRKQPAAGPFPKGSHGLCPYFYNSAFKNLFYAEPQPNNCRSNKRNKLNYPEKYRMGYMETRRSCSKNNIGELYATTVKEFPFNNLQQGIKADNYDYDYKNSTSLEEDIY